MECVISFYQFVGVLKTSTK